VNEATSRWLTDQPLCR